MNGIGNKAEEGCPVAALVQTRLFDKSTQKGDAAEASVPVIIPTLTFLSGDAVGKELPLLQAKVVLGRGEESDVLVLDPSVSRRHAQVLCRAKGRRTDRPGIRVLLEDLGSTNGTLVNSKRVTRAELRPGDKILIGQTVLKFEFRDLNDQQFYEDMFRMATTDELTSLENRFSIVRCLTEEVSKSARYLRRLSVILVDIGNFKSLNDTFGHLAGDRVLSVFATVVRERMRKQDRAGRFGGEEFLIVLPETGLRGAATLAERIRSGVEEHVGTRCGIERPVTASFGVATFRLRTGTPEGLLEQADRALYRAKSRGKNRVEVWKEPLAVGSSAA
jgi:diguanylate cyclase (GGDEF)-like protein